MNKFQILAVLSVVSAGAALMPIQAQADVIHGGVNQFVSTKIVQGTGELHATFGQLNPRERGLRLGFGGGDWALKLSNSGFTSAAPMESSAGGATIFPAGTNESVIRVVYKPVNIKVSNLRLAISLKKQNGEIYTISGPFNNFSTRQLGDSDWNVLEVSIDSLPADIRGAAVERVSYELGAGGDDGYVLIGNTAAITDNTVVEPSIFISESAPSGSDSSQLCTARNR
jgi:hypothetical protein